MAKKPVKKSPLQLHNNDECGCSITVNPNNCVYQKFIDGWDFTPDIGRGKSSAEIFTPRFIVDKMITDSKMFPTVIINNPEYDLSDLITRNELTIEEALKIVHNRIVEPAVGTANFMSTIAYHKLKLVHEICKHDSSQDYHSLLLTAVSSLYAFDIDPGNLQTAKQRLLGSETHLNSPERKTYWVSHILSALSKENAAESILEGSSKTVEEAVSSMVHGSMDVAQHNWWNNFEANSFAGVVDTAYEAHTGVSLPNSLREQVAEILDINFKLFNGIEHDDTVEPGFVVPGYHSVAWNWWSVNSVVDVSSNLLSNASFEVVRLVDQLGDALESKKKPLKRKLKVNVSVSDADTLF